MRENPSWERSLRGKQDGRMHADFSGLGRTCCKREKYEATEPVGLTREDCIWSGVQGRYVPMRRYTIDKTIQSETATPRWEVMKAPRFSYGTDKHSMSEEIFCNDITTWYLAPLDIWHQIERSMLRSLGRQIFWSWDKSLQTMGLHFVLRGEKIYLALPPNMTSKSSQLFATSGSSLLASSISSRLQHGRYKQMAPDTFLPLLQNFMTYVRSKHCLVHFRFSTDKSQHI